MSGTQEAMGSGVPGGTHPIFKNMGSGVQANWAKVGSGFQVGIKKVSSGFQVGTQKVGSGFEPKSGFRVPGRNPESGLQWVLGKLGRTWFGHSIAERHFESLIDNLDNILPKIQNIQI